MWPTLFHDLNLSQRQVKLLPVSLSKTNSKTHYDEIPIAIVTIFHFQKQYDEIPIAIVTIFHFQKHYNEIPVAIVTIFHFQKQ